MSQQTPLYQGTQFAPAKIAGATSPTQHPFAQQFQAANQGIAQTARNFELAIQDRQEYTLEQKRSAALQEAAHSMNMEFMDRLQRADGTEGSLFDEFGQLNQEAVNDLKQKYLTIADAWTTGFTTERGMRAAAEAQNKYRASVVESIDSKILASLKPRALQALQNNMDLAIMRGEYDYADAYATDALSRGMLSKAEVDAIHYKNNRLRQINIIDNTDDAETLSNYYHDPANQDFLKENPAIADRALRKLEALLTYKGVPESVLSDGSDEKLVSTTATAEQSTTGTTASSTSGTSKPKIKRAEPPPAADGFIKLHFLMHGDDLKSPEAQKNAHALFLKYVGTIADIDTTPDGEKVISEQARFEAELLAKTLQLPESAVNRILNQRQEALQATLFKFNPASARTSLYSTFKASQDVVSGSLPKKGKHTDYWKGVFAAHARDIENALHLAENDFYKWYADHPEADDVQQARAYQQFVHNRRSQELIDYPAHGWNHMRIGEYFAQFEASANRAGMNRVLDEYQRKAYEKQLQAETDHYNKVKDNAEMLRDYYRGDIAGAAIRRQVNQALDHQFSNFRFTINLDNPARAASLPNSNSELILYVNPEETGSFSNQRSFLIPYNGNVYNVKIVDTEAVDTAVPSIKMQQTFKLLGKKYNRFDFSNNTLNSLYYKKSNKSKSDYIYRPDAKGRYRATGNNIYSIMLENEVRRDSQGRPQVYELPAEDGGGTHEVAGLNTKYNPKEFKELKSMIESGASNEEIENYIFDAYEKKTQYGVDLLGYNYSEGVELFIRDCSLNHSPKGVKKILAKAVGSDSTADITTKIQAYMQTHSEEDFLNALNKARAWYYNDIVRKQPQKSKFTKGWANRNSKITKSAKSLLASN